MNNQIKPEDKIKYWREEGFAEYASLFLKIRDKSANIVPFKINMCQQIIDDVANNCVKQGRPTRIICVKGRQQGISTYSSGKMYNQTTLKPNYRSTVVSYKEDSSIEVFRMFKRYGENMPDGMKLDVVTSNKTEVEFKTGSVASIATAGDQNLGSSFTYNYVHITELAKWENPEDPFLAVMQTIPDLVNTFCIVESTAAGVGDLFHKTWNDAVMDSIAAQRKGIPYLGFIPVFLPWYIHKEYQLPFLSKREKDEFIKNLDQRDQNHFRYLLNEHRTFKAANGQVYEGVTLEKLKWYDYILTAKCSKNRMKRLQEYPSTPEEAFMASSQSVFPSMIVDAKIKEILANPKKVNTGSLQYSHSGERVVFIDDDEGFWSIYKPPEPDKTYIVSADVAEGLEHGDNDSADVICREDLEQVAHMATNKIDTDQFAKELMKISRYYNNAWINPESNNHGLSVIKRMQWEGENRIWNEQNLQTSKEEIRQNRYGWQTNARTKPLMIDNLVEGVRDSLITINDLNTWREMSTYVKVDGKMMAVAGCKDDRVMSLAIGYYSHTMIPYTAPEPLPGRRGSFDKSLDELWSQKGGINEFD